MSKTPTISQQRADLKLTPIVHFETAPHTFTAGTYKTSLRALSNKDDAILIDREYFVPARLIKNWLATCGKNEMLVLSRESGEFKYLVFETRPKIGSQAKSRATFQLTPVERNSEGDFIAPAQGNKNLIVTAVGEVIENAPKPAYFAEVALAAGTDPASPAFTHVHFDKNRMVAADGFRIHIAELDYAIDVCPTCAHTGNRYADFTQVIPHDFTYTAQVDAQELKQALMVVSKIAKHDSQRVFFACNEQLSITADSIELGASGGTVACLESEGAVEFAVNVGFALDALKLTNPKNGIVTIQANNRHSPVVFEHENRKAVLMPMARR